MKKILGLVVILAVLVLASYYGMGYKTEQKLRESVNFINQTNGIVVNIKQYHRGWFTSKADFDWTIHIPERVTQVNGQSQTQPAQDYTMQMPLKIYHGPIIFSDKGLKFGLGFAHTNLNLPESYVQQFNSNFTSESTIPKIDMDFFVSYLGNTRIDTAVPSFSLYTKQGDVKFQWLGMLASTNVASNLNKIGGSIHIKGVDFSKEKVDTKLSTVSSEYQLHKTENGLFLGDASLSFPLFTALNNGQKILELFQFNFSTQSDIENGLFSSHLKTSLDKMIANNITYGPANLEISIQNLDGDALARLNAEAQQAQHGTDTQKQQALLAMVPELPKLFSKGAVFEINSLSFVMPQGTIEGNLKVTLPKGQTTNPFELMQKIQGSGRIKVPAAVVRQVVTESIKQKLMAPPPANQTTETGTGTGTGIAQQIQPTTNPTDNAQAAMNATDVSQQAVALADKQLAAMLQNGLIVQQGNDFVLVFTFNQGQLTINGKPFSSAMVKF